MRRRVVEKVRKNDNYTESSVKRLSIECILTHNKMYINAYALQVRCKESYREGF